jgi:DNA-binding MarR family transcriptional regulator
MPAVETFKRRDQVADEIVLGVLDVVENDPAVTQRSVANELGIALGLANAYLKRCVRKGLIKVGQVPTRRYAYFLTPQGFAEKSRLTAEYLAHSFSFLRRAREQFAVLFTEAAGRGQRRIVLIGAGDLAEIATLVVSSFQIEIVGVVAGDNRADALKASVSALGQVDAVVITALKEPREIFNAAIEAFGAANVYALPLLRIRPPSPEAK